MDEKRLHAIGSDTKSATVDAIPPPVLQPVPAPPHQRRWVWWSIAGLFACTFYIAAQSCDPCYHHGTPTTSNDCTEPTLPRSIPNEESALGTSRLFASKPHMAGSPSDFETAKLFLTSLQHELGITPPSSGLPIFSAGSYESRSATLNISSYAEPTAWIDTYYPMLNSPLNQSLEILDSDGNPIWTAELDEFSDEADPYAAEYAKSVPTWHGFSRGGEAQGKLVYAKYGRKRDYDELVKSGVDLTGKIILARYGGNFRGLKVKRAQELGAAAVLIYSDPRDDGTVTSQNGYAPYPHGPARNPTSVQRGSVQYLSLYPGDPTTPGYPSYEDSVRSEGLSRPAIPSFPISWKNAEILLKQMVNGIEGPTVRLVNNVDEKVTPIWNVLGVIPGHVSGEVIVLGGHRDGKFYDFCLRTADRGIPFQHGYLEHPIPRLAQLLYLRHWDGEEFGLVGSTEWGEDFTEWVRDHVVAYVNIDTAVSGSRFRTSASPLLAHLLRNTALQIPHPTSEGRTLWDAHDDTGTFFGDVIDNEVLAVDESEQESTDDLGIRPLGSGSDYTVFLQYIGVPSVDACFTSTLHDPVYHYHSVFDSQRWQEVYGDPAFSRHVAIAKHIGLQVLHLSGNIILPFNTTHYSLQLEAYLQKVMVLSKQASFDIDFSTLHDSIRALQAASINLDKEKNEAKHRLKKILKLLRKKHSHRRKIIHKVEKAICKLKRLVGKECHSRDVELLANAGFGFGHTKKRLLRAIERVQAVNRRLIAFERAFISKEGIKDREWYKHLGVAPGKWLGYGATTFPGLSEAITIDKDPVEAVREVKRLEAMVGRLLEVTRL
ncbi:hypothetical protein ID866_3975 [Astraeus odoratus]|nr:hypothetical protein ID866_3975 [Astraeus odoratus]